MKKLKLLLAFCALLIGWSNAWAQNPGDDYTSSITNPTFTNNADGWTITGQARYYNGKGFDGTTNFIELTNWGSSWDATISQTVTSLPNGYFLVKAAGQMSSSADCWMKLVANGAESRFSRNGDTNGNILANGTETTIGSGVAGWRYTSVIAKVTDGNLAISCVGHSNVKERWANFDAVTLTFLGTEFAPNTDVTEYISNWDFWGCFNDEFNGWTIEKTGGNSWVHGNTAVEHWSNDMSRTFDFYQTINNLPEGRYQISASMWNTQGTPNGNSGVYGTSSNGTVFAGVTVDCDDSHLQTYTTNGIFVNDGTLRLGVKNNGERSTNWFGVDWIKLQYVGKVVADYAVALPAGGAMVADTWYYFDIAVAGDDYNATATTLGDIICTDDGNTLTSAATGNVTLTAKDNNFAAKRYYVKSSSANNLEIGVASYTYTVSEASVDKTYIQPSQTVTVSFTASTNDPGATLDQNYSGVRFNDAAISVTPTASGFTFTVPTVTANTEYTLVIPAGAIGYDEGSTYNAAQEITLKTPAVFDGTYYLYDATSGLFLSSGADYGSRANVDAYGKPIIWNNSTKMLAFKNSTGVNFFFDNADHTNCWIYTDGNSSRGDNRKFEFVSNGAGKYYLQDFAKAVYLKHDNSVINVPVTDAAEATTWTVLSKAERDAIVAAYPAANKTSVITAAGLSGSTDAAGFETYLSENYVAKDQTSKVGTAKFAGSRGDWTWNQSRARDGQPAYGTDFCEIYEATGNFSQTISGLDEGIYKVTVNAFERSAGWSVCNDNGAEGYEIVTSYFAANDEKVLLKSWYSQKEGENNPNNTTQAATAFNNDKYKNEVYVYVPASGELTLKLAKPTYVASSWVLFNNVTLTYYSSTMDPSDVTDLLDKAEEYLEKPMLATLKSAISTAKSALESVSSVANYNALNTALDNSETSIASYANMKTNYIDYIASIKENTNFYSADANTVYENNVTAYNNGTITNADANALATTISRYDSPAQNFLMPVWKIGETAATTAESGFYQNTWSGEGASDGSGFLTPFFEYWVSSGNVLPATTLTGTLAGLTPNASYKVEAWVRVQTTDGQTMADNGVTMKVGTGTPVDVTKGSRIGETTRYIKEYVAYGNADASGNLVVTFTVAASSNVSWLAFKNVNYSTVVPVTITASGYATFSSASALDLIPANTPDGLEAYYVGSEGVKDTYVSLTRIEQTVAANEGILFKGTAGETYNVPVAASGDALTGNQLHATDGNEVAAGNFVFAFENENPSTTAGFYTLKTGTVIAAGKAYLQKPAFSVKAFLPFDGTATGVEAPEVAEAEEEEILYNTAGVRVGKDYKGIVINQKGEKRLQK